MTIEPSNADDLDGRARHGASSALALFDIRTVFDPNSAAIETLRSVLGSDGDTSGVAWIALPSPTGELMIEYVHGATTPLLRQLQIPDGRGLTGKVFSSGAIGWVEHYATATSITHEFDSVIEAEDVVRMLAAPLRVNDSVAGVLTLASRMEGAFGDVAIDRIDGLARHVGVALEIARRTRLYAEAAAAAERQRISEELHDGMGALLFSINSRAERLRARFDSGEVPDADFDALQRDLALAGRGMRDLLSGWRGAEESDLHGEIVADANDFEARSGARCTVVFLGGALALDPDRAAAMKKFVREALLNVEKHAHASSVSITVAALATQTTIAVSDDGRGLTDNADRGFGLVAAADRVARLGGTVSVVNDDAGVGVVARAVIPT